MPYTLYDAAVPAFRRQLKALAACLAKGAAHCEVRKIDPAVLLASRLSPDMYPLTRQVQIATDHAKGSLARLAGREVPSLPDTEASFAELDARIAKTLALVEACKAEELAGAESRQVVMLLGPQKMRFEFTGADYLNHFALPNFYFHVTTAYAILRHCGVELGKRDFIGGL